MGTQNGAGEPIEMIPAFGQESSQASPLGGVKGLSSRKDGPERRDYIFHLALGGLDVFQEMEDVDRRGWYRLPCYGTALRFGTENGK